MEKSTTTTTEKKTATTDATTETIRSSSPTKTTPEIRLPQKAKWHTNRHLPYRRKMIFKIMNILRSLDPLSNQKRLPHSAKYIEQLLYRGAASFECYNDETTLHRRIQRAVAATTTIKMEKMANAKGAEGKLGKFKSNQERLFNNNKAAANGNNNPVFQEKAHQIYMQRQFLQQREKELMMQEEKFRQLAMQNREKDELLKLWRQNAELRKLKHMSLREQSLLLFRQPNVAGMY